MSRSIAHQFNNTAIRQRPDDGYVDATAMCLATGKQFNDYFRLETTQAFLEALSLKTGIPVIKTGIKNEDSAPLCLVETKPGRYGGTWVHPKVAIHLGQWCSPEFAVFVTELVFAWMTDNLQALQKPLLHPDVQRLHGWLLSGELTQVEMRLLVFLVQVEAVGKLNQLNQEAIAAQLQISKSTLYRTVGRLRELGIADLQFQRVMRITVLPASDEAD